MNNENLGGAHTKLFVTTHMDAQEKYYLMIVYKKYT